jgi:hypothetical protein
MEPSEGRNLVLETETGIEAFADNPQPAEIEHSLEDSAIARTQPKSSPKKNWSLDDSSGIDGGASWHYCQ